MKKLFCTFFATFVFRYSFICQGTSAKRQRRTFSIFESSCHLLLQYLTNHPKVEAIPLRALPKGTCRPVFTTSELAGLSSHYSFLCWTSSREAV